MKIQLIIKEAKNKNWKKIKPKVLEIRNRIKRMHIDNLGPDSYSSRRDNYEKNNTKFKGFRS